MTRSQLEHLIRASGAIAQDNELVIIGSQAILGTDPNPPSTLTFSMEADIYPRTHLQKAADIDGAIGEGSRFHETYGYYAQGVSPETATLPSNWRNRLRVIQGPNTNGVAGYCLDAHDLVLSKYVANREKDRDFNRVVIRHGYAEQQRLLDLLEEMPVPPVTRDRIRSAIDLEFSQLKPVT